MLDTSQSPTALELRAIVRSMLARLALEGEYTMSISILVVDDEPDMVELFKRKFRREIRSGDYSMYFAGSGEAALDVLGSDVGPELMLALSDINMPGMSGIELVKETKKQWPDLPVAVITAYGDRENKGRAMEAGAADFLTKPIDFIELKNKIFDLIQSTDN